MTRVVPIFVDIFDNWYSKFIWIFLCIQNYHIWTRFIINWNLRTSINNNLTIWSFNQKNVQYIYVFKRRYYKNNIKNNKFSMFNAKFTLNNVPCELEYDLSKFNLENLQKLVIFTTQKFNNNDKYSLLIKILVILTRQKT